jgi:photosystem II stability/assembly factor-like uncharacterized protein
MKNLYQLLILLFLSQICVNAQGGWSWQHPLPQGNDLRDIFVLDENIIFTVGDRGTLLHSDNSGTDWEITHRLEDITENIVDIEFVSEQKGYLLANKHLLDEYYNIVYSSSKILFTEDAGIHWIVIADFDLLRLNDLCFIDENTGWLVGYKEGTAGTLTGMVLKTIDGGHNWDTLFTQVVYNQPAQDDKSISFSTIQFIDSENGWAAGKSSGLWENSGELLGTTNGGLDWYIKNDSLNVVSSFQFLNSDIGWLTNYEFGCAYFSWIYDYSIKKTTDGGLNWEEVFNGGSRHSSTFYLPSLYFIDPNTGWVKEGNNIHKTTDGGLSWLTETLHTPRNGAMHFNNELNGCVVGKNGEILTTEDGGQSWIERSTMTTYKYDILDCHLLSVHFYDESIGWATGWGYTPVPDDEGGYYHGRLFSTSDGGSSWVEQLYILSGGKSSAIIRDVQAINDQFAYAIGDDVIKTTNGGEMWDNITTGWAEYSALFFLNADTGFVGVGDGINIANWSKIYKTTNGGMEWDTVLSVLNTSIESLFFINNSVGWAVGRHHSQTSIYKTIDEGDTWQEITVNDFSLKSICFGNEDVGLAVGNDGVIIRTTDGGYNWDVIYNLNGYEFRSVYFIDSSRGFVVGREGYIYLLARDDNITGIILSVDDVGGNFSVKQESWTKGLNDVYFLNSITGWAAGDGGTIIKTGDGISFAEEEEINEIPSNYYLSNNYPNPFTIQPFNKNRILNSTTI